MTTVWADGLDGQRRGGLAVAATSDDPIHGTPWVVTAAPANRIDLRELHPSIALFRLVFRDAHHKSVASAALTWAQSAWRVPHQLADDLAQRRRAVIRSLVRRDVRPVVVQVRVHGESSWMLLGLGNEATPSGTGLPFDQTTGAPIIPGSSLRGVARRGTDESTRLFGSPPTSPSTSKHPGLVGVLDAIPGTDLRLCLDVLTPHQAGFIDGTAPPDGLADPVPVPLLAVSAGRFETAVFSTSDSTTQSDVERAAMALCDGVAELGIGAKTAAGYGYLEAQIVDR